MVGEGHQPGKQQQPYWQSVRYSADKTMPQQPTAHFGTFASSYTGADMQHGLRRWVSVP